VVWKEPVEGQTSPDSLVPIDPATLSSEIQLRGDFIATIEEPLRSQLSKTLEDSRPLQTFGKVVQETQLNILWHSFRTKRVLEKIQRWASEKKVEWKDAWLTQGRTVNRGKEREFGLPAPSGHLEGRRTEGDPLHLLFSGLDAADIQRISIPLDLVLKVLSARKKP